MEKSKTRKLRDSQLNKEWYKANREHAILTCRNYQNNNKEKVKAYQREYRRKRYASDPQYRLAQSLRSRLNGAINNNQKAGSAIKDLGCSMQEFLTYIESKFLVDMSWDNYGEWELDHIKPLSQFDLTSRIQFLEACHYSNLQPLWKEDNIRKSDE